MWAPIQSAEQCLHPQVWFCQGDKYVRCSSCLREWKITDESRVQTGEKFSDKSRHIGK